MTEQENPLFIVTGATEPTGRMIATRIASRGRAVALACLNVEKAQAVAEQIAAETGNTDVTALHLNLNSFASVQAFVGEVQKTGRKVAAIVNNAGFISNHSQLSDDGYEKTVQVNFLSTVLLSMSLVPCIVPGGRIIFTTSLARHMVSLPFEFPAESHFTRYGTYAHSKLALTLFSIYMSTTLKTRHINVNCADLGFVDNNIVNHASLASRISKRLFKRFAEPSEDAIPILRALESNDTGFIFIGHDKLVKAATMLKNREVFIKLCNDTMRLLKKYLPKEKI